LVRDVLLRIVDRILDLRRLLLPGRDRNRMQRMQQQESVHLPLRNPESERAGRNVVAIVARAARVAVDAEGGKMAFHNIALIYGLPACVLTGFAQATSA
jgi:hypothetical protein